MTIRLEDIETTELIKKLKEKKITEWEYSEWDEGGFSNIFKTNLNENYKVKCVQHFAVAHCSDDDFGHYYIRVYDRLGNNICESFNKSIPNFYESIKLRFEENEILKKAKIEETHKKDFDKFTKFLCEK